MDFKASFIPRRTKDYIYLNTFFYALDYALQEDLIKVKSHKTPSYINVTMKSDILIICFLPNYLSYSPNKFSSWT